MDGPGGYDTRQRKRQILYVCSIYEAQKLKQTHREQAACLPDRRKGRREV